jgi:hypothetical protein
VQLNIVSAETGRKLSTAFPRPFFVWGVMTVSQSAIDLYETGQLGNSWKEFVIPLYFRDIVLRGVDHRMVIVDILVFGNKFGSLLLFSTCDFFFDLGQSIRQLLFVLFATFLMILERVWLGKLSSAPADLSER